MTFLVNFSLSGVGCKPSCDVLQWVCDRVTQKCQNRADKPGSALPPPSAQGKSTVTVSSKIPWELYPIGNENNSKEVGKHASLNPRPQNTYPRWKKEKLIQIWRMKKGTGCPTFHSSQAPPSYCSRLWRFTHKILHKQSLGCVKNRQRRETNTEF